MKIKNTYIPTYEDCLEICKYNKTFYESKHLVDGYNISTFNYRLSVYNDFINPIPESNINAKELRGITFIFNNDGSLFKRYLFLQKFWNINQVEETQYGDIKGDEIVEIFDKVDGSLCAFVKLPNGKFVGKTQNSFDNPQTLYINELFNSNKNIQKFVEWCEENNYVALFEYVSFNNKIVLNYDKSELVLLRVRNNDTGEYILDFNSDGLKVAESEKLISLEEIIELTKNQENKEGWVVTMKNSLNEYYMIKIKTQWYCDRHHLLTEELNREDYIIEMICNEKIDDVIAQLNPVLDKNKIEWVNDIVKIVQNYIIEKVDEVQLLINEYDGDVKSFAIKYNRHKNFPHAIAVINGKIDLYNAVKNYLLKNTNKLELAREFIRNKKL